MTLRSCFSRATGWACTTSISTSCSRRPGWCTYI